MTKDIAMRNRVDRLRKKARKFTQNRLSVLGLVFVILFAVLLLGAPAISKFDPSAPNFGALSQAPSKTHLCGTDQLGRDLFARILYGGRMSCYIAIVGSLFSTLIGMVLGCVAGYVGGLVDNLLTRLSEVFQIFPQMIIIMIAASFLGASVANIIIIFSITGWTGTFRQVRAEFLSLREETYIEVCRSFGMPRRQIIFGQMLPSVMTTIVIQFSMRLPGLVLSEAGLSFIGIGVPSSVITWGNLLNAAQSISVITNYWWVWVIPGVVLAVFVLTVNFLGDGIRDILDPRQQ